MELEDAIRNAVVRAVAEKFAEEDITNIELKSIRIDEDRSEIHIIVSITTSAQPKDIAKGYFGLTRNVRAALGKDWSDFFPVITPEIETSSYA